MENFLVKLHSDDPPVQRLVEYSLLLVLLIVVLIIAAVLLGPSLGDIFSFLLLALAPA